jgi:hypothetical protein
LLYIDLVEVVGIGGAVLLKCTEGKNGISGGGGGGDDDDKHIGVLGDFGQETEREREGMGRHFVV